MRQGSLIGTFNFLNSAVYSEEYSEGGWRRGGQVGRPGGDNIVPAILLASAPPVSMCPLSGGETEHSVSWRRL